MRSKHSEARTTCPTRGPGSGIWNIALELYARGYCLTYYARKSRVPTSRFWVGKQIPAWQCAYDYTKTRALFTRRGISILKLQSNLHLWPLFHTIPSKQKLTVKRIWMNCFAHTNGAEKTFVCTHLVSNKTACVCSRFQWFNKSTVASCETNTNWCLKSRLQYWIALFSYIEALYSFRLTKQDSVPSVSQVGNIALFKRRSLLGNDTAASKRATFPTRMASSTCGGRYHK